MYKSCFLFIHFFFQNFTPSWDCQIIFWCKMPRFCSFCVDKKEVSLCFHLSKECYICASAFHVLFALLTFKHSSLMLFWCCWAFLMVIIEYIFCCKTIFHFDAIFRPPFWCFLKLLLFNLKAKFKIWTKKDYPKWTYLLTQC